MRQGVEANHIARTVGRAFRTTNFWPGQGVDCIEAQGKGLGVMHHRQNGENADPVSHEIGRIQRPNNALAQPRGQPGFEAVKRRRGSAAGGNDLYQRHVARWVEEMNAAEIRT